MRRTEARIDAGVAAGGHRTTRKPRHTRGRFARRGSSALKSGLSSLMRRQTIFRTTPRAFSLSTTATRGG